MKKLILPLILGGFFTSNAQRPVQGTPNYSSQPIMISNQKHDKIDLYDYHKIASDSKHALVEGMQKSMADIGNNETLIGETEYSYQTNASICRRIITDANGNIAASWTHSTESSPIFSDRGTGYNFFDAAAGSWGSAAGISRIESTRTGWPTLSQVGTKEITISHGTEIDQLVMNQRSTVGSGAWTETFLSAISPIALWPRFAVGGANSQTIHLIGLSTPTAFGGALYNGMDGALLYTRSTDGGANWDAPIQLPETDLNYYPEISGDVYSIDVKGDKIAIGIAELGQPVRLLISEDNGTSWTSKIALDNGIGKYDETVNEFDFISTSGGSIATLIDNNNKVHAFFDHIGMSNELAGDEQIGLYLFGGSPESFVSADSGVFIGGGLGSFGLGYWNEDFQEGDWRTVGSWYYDFDESGDFSALTDNLDGYRLGNMNQFAAMPTVSVDQDNNMYVFYAALTDYTPDGVNFLRHTFGVSSTDGGCSWSFPIDITPGSLGYGGSLWTDPSTGNPIAPDVHDLDECMYTSSVRDVTDTVIDLVMSIDINPGILQDQDGAVLPSFSQIVHKQVHVDDLKDFLPPLDCFTYVDQSDLLDGDLCSGNSATLVAGCGQSFEWNDGSTASTYTISTPGLYTVTINTGCSNIFYEEGVDNPADSVVIDTIEIEVATANAPLAEINGNVTLETCDPAATTTLFATPQPDATYTWSISGGNGNLVDANVGDQVSVVVSNCAGSTTSNTVTIMADTSLIPEPEITGDVEICTGETATLFASAIPTEQSFGATFGWSNGPNGPSTTANAGDQVILTITNCAGSGSDTADVFISPLPNTAITADSTTGCEGVGLTLTASGASTYTWPDGSTGETLFLDLPSQSGDYFAVGENLCNQTENSNTISIAIDPAPAAPTINYVFDDNAFVFSSDASGTHEWYAPALAGTNANTYSTTIMPEGTNVYAVVYDANGCPSAQSNTLTPVPVSVDLVSKENAFKVYPNPSNGIFTLELLNAQNASIEIRNVLGKVVYANATLNHTYDIDLSSYAKGLYFLSIIDQDNTTSTIRLMVK